MSKNEKKKTQRKAYSAKKGDTALAGPATTTLITQQGSNTKNQQCKMILMLFGATTSLLPETEFTGSSKNRTNT